jgi:hypothetical protein
LEAVKKKKSGTGFFDPNLRPGLAGIKKGREPAPDPAKLIVLFYILACPGEVVNKLFPETGGWGGYLKTEGRN